MFAFNRWPWPALAALVVVTVSVLSYSAPGAAGRGKTAEVAKPTEVLLEKPAPVRLPGIVITAKRSAEFAGPSRADKVLGRG